MASMTDIGYRIRDTLIEEAEFCGEGGDVECMKSVLRKARTELARDPDLLFDVETAIETYFSELTGRKSNPIKGMPGGSVAGCIKLVSKRKDVDDPGAYCAAIADRIEPGWRKRQRNPKPVSRERIRKTIEKTRAEGKAVAEHFGLRLHEGLKDRKKLFHKHGVATPLRWEHWEFLGESPLFRMFGAGPSLYGEADVWVPVLEEELERMEDRAAAGELVLEANPKKQMGLFGEKQAEVEGFALVPLEGKPVKRVRPPTEEQERLLPAEKPSREAMERMRKRELEERAARRKRRKNPLTAIKRRLMR